MTRQRWLKAYRRLFDLIIQDTANWYAPEAVELRLAISGIANEADFALPEIPNGMPWDRLGMAGQDAIIRLGEQLYWDRISPLAERVT